MILCHRCLPQGKRKIGEQTSSAVARSERDRSQSIAEVGLVECRERNGRSNGAFDQGFESVLIGDRQQHEVVGSFMPLPDDTRERDAEGKCSVCTLRSLGTSRKIRPGDQVELRISRYLRE